MRQLTLVSLSEYAGERNGLAYTSPPCLRVETEDGRDDDFVTSIWYWWKLEKVAAHDQLNLCQMIVYYVLIKVNILEFHRMGGGHCQVEDIAR